MPRRPYGSGHLFARTDKRGRVVWYGQWRLGDVKVKRTIGLKREPGSREGLTRAQAERELRRRMEAETVVRPVSARRSLSGVGEQYVDHLEHVMERKATTVKDYRGYLRGHFEPFFGDRPVDRIDERWVAAYLKRKREGGLSAKTVHNHLNFLHGLFQFAIKRGWADQNPVALVDRPRKPHRSSPRLQFLQPIELEALIRAVPRDDLGAVERPLYLTAAMTGMRQGELIALRGLTWTG